MVLTRSQIRQFYDRFGRKQDSQAFYEDAGLDDLIAHSAFGHAQSMFEIGCGTGRFALRLLTECLPSSASYLGIDLSRTMINIAKERLAPFAGRAKVLLTDGAIEFPLPDHSVDRVVATYVLDVLRAEGIEHVVREAERVLRPGGKLCLTSLSKGVTLSSRIVAGLWSALFRLHAAWVGGCRPIELESFVDRQRWIIEHQNVVVRFGVPSEVLVATLARQSKTSETHRMTK